MKKIRLANSHLISNNPTHIKINDDLQSEDYIRVKWKTQNCYQRQLNDENISSIEKKIESLDYKKLFTFNDEPKIHVSYLLYLKSLCRKINDSQKAIIDDYILNKEFIENVFDVVTLVKFYKEFQFMKEIILNEEQIIALDLIKPKFSKEVKKKEILQKKLILYFTKLQKEQKIDKIDRKLLESILEEERFNAYLNKLLIE